MEKISAVLIVKNEEKKLEGCLESLTWVDEIVIVDATSTDRTRDIARRYTDKVFERNFDNFADQKNFGIDQASGDWILSVDADEKVSLKLRLSIEKVLRDGTGYDGFMVSRRNIIFGKSLRFAGQRSEKILRLFRREKGRLDQPIHEKVVVRGSVGKLEGELIHESIQTLEEYFQKLNLYTDFEARFMLEQGVKASLLDYYFKPVLRFIYFYIFRLGFLDGYAGFLYHGLSSYYTFLKYAKLSDMRHQKKESIFAEEMVHENRH